MAEPYHRVTGDGFRPPQLPPTPPRPSLTALAAAGSFVAITGRTGVGKTYAAQGAARRVHSGGQDIVILDPLRAWLPTALRFSREPRDLSSAERSLSQGWEVVPAALNLLDHIQTLLSRLQSEGPLQPPLLVLDHLGFFNRPEAEWLGPVLELWRQPKYPVWILSDSVRPFYDLLAPHIAATPPQCRVHICFRQDPVPAGESLDLFPVVAPLQSMLPVPLANLADGQSVVLFQSDTLVGTYLSERLVEPWRQSASVEHVQPPEPLPVPLKRFRKPGQKKTAPEAGAVDAGQTKR